MADESKSRGSYSKYWCFTSFKQELKLDLPSQSPLTNDVTYIVVQREKAPDTGREHWQGYIEFSCKKRMASVQAVIGDDTAHCELRRGTAEQAAGYCKKLESRAPGSVPIELGVISKPVANQMVAVADAIREGASYEDICNEYPSAILRYGRGVLALIGQRDAKVEHTYRKLRVFELIGAAGTGKTRLAFEHANKHHARSTYVKQWTKGTTSWWDGAEDATCVILDDFCGDAPLDEFLTLLGGYGHNALRQTKGGHIRLKKLREVIITSNVPHWEWYPNARREHQEAIARRIDSTLTDEDDALGMVKREHGDLYEENVDVIEMLD